MDAPQALHPTDKTLHAYGLGRLDDPTAESVNTHLESCPTCRSRAAELSSDSFLGRLRDAHGQPDPAAPVVSSFSGLSQMTSGSSSVAPPPASTLPPGLADHVDYEILRELGRGGMGVVYLAQNKLMGRTEVLKVVSSHLVNRRGVPDRFLTEIRNAAKLDHPNVVTAYTALRLGESLGLAMQYVKGFDLAKVVQSAGPLPVADACNFIQQAALGLQHAHEHGMVHRDIKPSNLMLARQGKRPVIKVLDFGLAKVRSEGSTDGTLTHDGQMLGTPDYIAPEQIRNAKGADIRADIYSLGCTLYYLLTGGPPFQADSLYDLLQAHHSMDAKPLNLARPEVPAELAALVAKMMAKEPERRFQEPKEVAQALSPFFKKGDAAFKSPTVEMSQTGGNNSGRPTTGAVATPTQPATYDAGSIARPKKAAQASAPETEWTSLIELAEPERARDATPADPPSRRSPWFWPSIAVGVFLLGFVAWGAIVKIWTPEGVIVLRDLPDQASVLIDGKKATVRWPDGGGDAEITVAPGDRDVEVKQGGFSMRGRKVTVEKGGRTILTVELEPLETPGMAKQLRENRTSRSDFADGGLARAAIGESSTPPGPGEVATNSPTSPMVPAPIFHSDPQVATRKKDAKADAAARFTASPAGIQPINAAMALRGRAEIVSGHWLVEGTELVRTEAGEGRDGRVLFGDHHWTDYDFTVNLMREKGNDCAALCFRRTTRNDNQLVFVLSGFRDRGVCSITSLEDGEERGLRSSTSHFVNHKWYRARVTVRGNHIVCTLQDEAGKELVGLDAHDDRHPNGQVGLATENSSWRFKNIKVTAPDGRTLWEMPPAIGEASMLAAQKVQKSAAIDRGTNGPERPRATDAAPSPHGMVKIVSGLWSRVGDEIVQKHEDGGTCILVDDPSLSRFDMKFRAMIDEGKEGFAAVFDYSSPDENCQLAVGDTRRSEVALCTRHNGKWGRHGKPKRMPIELGRWYDVEVKVDGREYRCFVDGTEVFHNTLDERFTKGQVGLAAWDSVARFRDILITTPDGRILWKGPPNLTAQEHGSAPHVANEPAQARTIDAAVALKAKAEILSGRWRVEGKELVQGDKAGTILLGDEELSSYDLKFQGQIVAGNEGFVALFHRTDDDNLRFFHVGEEGGKSVHLSFLYRGNEGGKSKPTLAAKGRWYQVWVKVRGAECWCYLDGQELLHDVDKRFTKGRVGLATWDATARFRDIVVTTPEGEVLWKGLPEVPIE